MVFSHIEKLRGEYTDKYVTVDDQRPELRRFGGLTGVVKTVNMNGRALVQFDGRNNVGWYDIDVNFLKVIDEPLAEPEDKAARPRTTPKAPSALEKARRKKSASAVEPGAKKKSTTDILAAARGKKAADAPTAKSDATAAPPVQAKGGKMSTADILAAARAKKATDAPIGKSDAIVAPPAKSKGGKMSTADILAAARAKKATDAPIVHPGYQIWQNRPPPLQSQWGHV